MKIVSVLGPCRATDGDDTVNAQAGDQEIAIGRVGDHGDGTRLAPNDGSNLVAMQDGVDIRTALLAQCGPEVIMPTDTTTPAQEDQ